MYPSRPGDLSIYGQVADSVVVAADYILPRYLSILLLVAKNERLQAALTACSPLDVYL
jgi:hypothetical protein